MDREQVFQHLQRKDFNSIIKFLKTGKSLVAEDNILQQAVGYFFSETITLASQNPSDDNNFTITQLFILHANNFFNFNTEQFEAIVVHLAKNTKNLDEAIHYASKLPDNPICKEIINKHKSIQPIEIKHSQDSIIKTHEISSSNTYSAKSIFNSNQEKLFFFALRNCFPTHYIYPNAALSTISNSKDIDTILSSAELRFFYNTTVDFIVVDQFNDFKPIFAIELDSEWHRLHNQPEKDKVKNKIMKAIGLTLYRIEHLNRNKTIEEFQQVILETTRSR